MHTTSWIYPSRRVRAASTLGFSLVEVLVALVIVAIALGTTLRVARDRTTTLDALRARTLARWVAQNKIAEQRLSANITPGTTAGEVMQEGQPFRWSTLIETTTQPTDPVPITVTVGAKDGGQLATQRTWITRSIAPAVAVAPASDATPPSSVAPSKP